MSITRHLLIAVSLIGFVQPAWALTADMHYRRALEFRFSGDIDAAMIELQRALQLEPRSVQGHDQLGTLLLEEKGDLDGAISEFMTALEIDPGCASCQLHLNDAMDRRNGKAADQITRGNNLYNAGDYKRAAAAYRVATQIDPKDGVAHNSLAWTLYKLNSIKEGLHEIDEAMKLKPNDPELINTLACLQFEKGDVDAAIATWQKAISLSKAPGAADLYGLAVGYMAKNDPATAQKYFEQAIKTDPRYAEASFVRDRIGMSVRSMAYHDKLAAMVKKDKPAK
jgi:tetratricopeptide (TPR) repeat protein